MLFSKQSSKADEYLQIIGVLGFAVVPLVRSPAQNAE